MVDFQIDTTGYIAKIDSQDSLDLDQLSTPHENAYQDDVRG